MAIESRCPRLSTLRRGHEGRVHGREVVAQSAAPAHHLRELRTSSPRVHGGRVGPRAERDEASRVGVAADEIEEASLREVRARPGRELRPASDELVLASLLHGPVAGRESIADLGHDAPPRSASDPDGSPRQGPGRRRYVLYNGSSRALSSGGERFLDAEEVRGSNPLAPTEKPGRAAPGWEELRDREPCDACRVLGP